MSERHWYKCDWCGNWYSHKVEDMCKNCQPEKERKDSKMYPARYEIVEDPLPVEMGGFSAGAGFTTNDHLSNLRWSAYTTGTVILDTTNHDILKIYDKSPSGQRAIRQEQ